jgi:alkanesulfonate monooxygenase SsuD/methylene tetrahydromethanopterin reductase-like flavin-dependent oxidoreductase (luciferase family)
MREEFEAIGAPPYRERGAVSDEYIRAFKQLWTSDDPVFEGQYCGFSDIDFLPKPVQKPHPPIWIGGESPPALRRAATLGDAWYPIGTNPRFPVGTAVQMREYASRVRRHAEEAGRDPSELGLAYRATWSSETQELPEGGRKPFTGAPEQVASDVAAFAEVGVGHLHFDFQGASLDESLERMERFATEIRPAGP